MLDRDPKARTSPALWLPVAWMSVAILAARWLSAGEVANATEALQGNGIEGNLFSGLLAIGLIVLAGRRQAVSAILRMNGPILLFLCYCAVSTLWGDYPDVAFKRWIKSVGDVAMIMIVLTDPERSTAVKQFLTRVGLLLLPTSVLLIHFYPALGVVYFHINGNEQVIGVTNDKNLLGAICLVFGLAFLWRFLSAFRGRRHPGANRQILVAGVMLPMTLWLMWKANSATSTGCFALAGCAIAVMGVPSLAQRRAAVHACMASIFAVAFFGLFLNVGAGLVAALGRDQTLTGRTDLWQEVLGMAASPWIGAGFESFWSGRRLDEYWSRHIFHTAEAHNGYLEVFLNLGWVGIALLAVVGVAGYRNASGMLRWDREGGSLRLGYFMAGLTYSFAEAGFRLLSPVWICFLLAVTAVPEISGARDALAEVASPEQPIVKAPGWTPAKQRNAGRAPAGPISRKGAAAR
jgi:exopolysaccharide production protein ExoQ